MKNKGFTLIELLVVIAIIGILSSVVLASLNSARSKGANASIKSNLANLRAGAELYYDTSGSTYAGFCASSQYLAASSSIISSGVAAPACFADVNGWSASAPLKTAENGNGHYCVGSSGSSKAVSAAVTGTSSCQ
jgi:type IV pilus assembly protein PilA